MQIFLILAAFLSITVNGQSCPRNVPDELKVECQTLLNTETACRLKRCCWDGSVGKKSDVPRCFQSIEENVVNTTADAPVATSTTSAARTSTSSSVQLSTSTASRTSTSTVSPTASSDADNSSSGPSTGAKVGYVLAGIAGFLILVAIGTYAYNKFTEDDDSGSAPKLDLLSPAASNAEPQLQRHDNWMKEVPPIPATQNLANDPNVTQYAPSQYDSNAAYYDPNAVQYDPNAAYYDPNAVHYDPNAVQYDQYDPNAAAYHQDGQYYSSEVGQEHYYENQQQNPQFAHQPHPPMGDNGGNPYYGRP
jgi:hypothetical protein